MKRIRQYLTWQHLLQFIGVSIIAYSLYLAWQKFTNAPDDWEIVQSVGDILLGLAGLGALFASQRVPATPILAIPPPTSTAAGWLRFRENSLLLLQQSKVDPVLRNDLAQLTLELGMEYTPYAVARTLESRDLPPQPIPADKTIHQVFVEAGRRLLLLGAPGSGKSFTLMQLAQMLIDKANKDETRPIPLVFNLASWDGKHDELVAWLEARVRLDDYPYVRNVADWIAHNQLILLLDGLDEVAADRRGDCLAAVNAFAEQYPTELVLVSRQQEYEALGVTAVLPTAVRLQPLSLQQVREALQEKDHHQAVYRALARDADLRELAETPLMLSMMAVAYRGRSLHDIPTGLTVEDRRHHLFEAYIDQMFVRRSLPPKAGYSESQARCWLAAVAHGLVAHDQTEFYIERLQPSWLPAKGMRSYRWTMAAVWFVLGGVLAYFLAPFFVFFGFVLLLFNGRLPQNWRDSWRIAAGGGLITGTLAVAPVLEVVQGVLDLDLGLNVALFASLASTVQVLLGGCFFAWLGFRRSERIQLRQQLRWSALVVNC